MRGCVDDLKQRNRGDLYHALPCISKRKQHTTDLVKTLRLLTEGSSERNPYVVPSMEARLPLKISLSCLEPTGLF